MKQLKYLCLLVLASILSACGSIITLEGGLTLDEARQQLEAQGPAEKKDPQELTIGLSLSTLNNPFFVSVEEGVIQAAEEGGSQVQSLDAQDDSAKQLNDVNDLIQQQVDVLLINPVDSAAIGPAVESANAAGIPVITIDRDSDGGQVVTLVASNNVEGGEMAANYIVDQLGEGAKVVQLEGTPGASATRERGQGFANVAEGSLDLVDSQTANFNRAEGLAVMENILQAHHDIEAVFSQNDEMALGAIEAINAAGLQDDMIVIGFDGTEDAIQSISDGELTATIAQQPEEMGRLAVQAAYDFYQGKDLEDIIPSPLELVDQ